MKKTELKVKGMHCRSCEMLVSEEVGEVAGVKKVEADHKAGIVRIESEDNVDLSAVKSKIKELGYEVV
ncbi:MAG: heavy-metal-associated domain-containing protein [Candidatus Altiarchaeota archaeon]|nr:heavy-metal-associated domain-containing protein [Candidatus Altiarchaeota archaeon]